MSDNYKEKYIYVKGKKIYVPDEVYRACLLYTSKLQPL